MASLLARLPLVGDYFDLRGNSRNDSETWLGWSIAALGSIGASAAALTNALGALIPATQLATDIVRVAIPLAVCIACATLVVRRQQRIVGLARAEVVEYRATARVRTTAKVCFPLLLAVTAYRFSELWPNRLRGATNVSGYVCKANGTPLGSAWIELVDADGQMISERRERLDSFGYFIVRAKPWAKNPRWLRAGDVECLAGSGATKLIDIDGARTSQSGCTDAGHDSDVKERIWELPCP